MFFEQNAEDKNSESLIKKMSQLQSEAKRLYSEFESTQNNCRNYGGGIDEDLERILNDMYWEAKELYRIKKDELDEFCINHPELSEHFTHHQSSPSQSIR